jgi:hypothetical protein
MTIWSESGAEDCLCEQLDVSKQRVSNINDICFIKSI